MTFDMWLVLALVVVAVGVIFGNRVYRLIFFESFRHPRQTTRIKVSQDDARVIDREDSRASQTH